MIKRLLAAALCTMISVGLHAQLPDAGSKKKLLKPKVVPQVTQTKYQLKNMMSSSVCKEMIKVDLKSGTISAKSGYKIFQFDEKGVKFQVVTQDNLNEDDVSLFAQDRKKINGVTYVVSCVCGDATAGTGADCTPTIKENAKGGANIFCSGCANCGTYIETKVPSKAYETLAK